MSTTTVDVSSHPPQGMPNMGVPLVNADRTVAYAWYRLFISLFNAVLAGTTTPLSLVSLSMQVQNLQGQITALQNQLDALQVGQFSGGADLPAHTAGFMHITLGGSAFRVPLYLP